MKRVFRSLCLALFLAATSSVIAATSGVAEDLPDPGVTHLSGPTVTIEMDLTLGRPLIGLMVDGKGPFKFVVDTGASLSVIDDGIARELGLEVVGKQSLVSPGATEEVVGDRVKAGRLEAGGMRIESPVLATMDLVGFSHGTIEGVLGRPHFLDLLLTFDYPGSQIVVTRDSLDRTDPTVIGIDPQAGSIKFPVDVAGVSVPMVLDTGSMGGFTLPNAMESQFKFRSPLQKGPTIRLVGGTHPSWTAPIDGTVRFGTVSYENPEVVLTTFAADFGNIGFKVLREMRVTVDLANALVRVERAAAAEPSVVQQPVRMVRRNGPMTVGGPNAKRRVGVSFEMTPSGFVKKHDGLVVNFVDAGGAGDRAGLKVADILLSVGGTAVAELDDMNALGELMHAPRPLEMELLRSGEPVTIVIE